MNRHQRRAFSIHVDNVRLRRKTVPHVGHIVDINGAAPYCLNRQIVEFAYRGRSAIHVHLVLKRPDLRRARRQNQILQGNGVDHVQRRKPFRLQRRRVQIHLDLPLLAAIGVGNCHARDGHQPGA